MTAKTESQLIEEIITELDTLLSNVPRTSATTLAALLVTLSDNVGVPTLADFTADLVALDTVCDALP